MNFSGRSVRLAKRVIEIDEVFDVRIVCVLQMWHQLVENRLFYGFVLGCSLDHQDQLDPIVARSSVVCNLGARAVAF